LGLEVLSENNWYYGAKFAPLQGHILRIGTIIQIYQLYFKAAVSRWGSSPSSTSTSSTNSKKSHSNKDEQPIANNLVQRSPFSSTKKRSGQSSNEVKMIIRQRGFPWVVKIPDVDLGSAIAAFFFPLVLTWMMPVLVHGIVLEKQEKLREMMKMVSTTPIQQHCSPPQIQQGSLSLTPTQMGLRGIDYWKVTYIYSAAVYLVVLIIVYLCSIIFGFGIISNGR